MTFEEYQKQALDTDSSLGHNTLSPDFMAVTLGLMSEAGEFGEKMKKIYWAKKGLWDNEDKKALAKELGDVLWYVSSLSNHVGVPLEEIAKANLEKLKSRKERNLLNGNGDDR
jgi:NTP pyrophosphatase (non-canonical NTP hydrolase)